MTTSDGAKQAAWVTCEHHWVWHLGTDISKDVVVATCSLCGHIKAGLATDRPTPPLPTEPGTTGTATVFGVEPACTCTRATSGHIVSLDPTCPATEPSTNTGKPSITTRDTNAYPTGLVERVAAAAMVPDSAAGLAALAVATWLDEQGALSYSHVAQAIRREVEGAGSS